MKKQVTIKQTLTIKGVAKEIVTEENVESIVDAIEDAIASHYQSDFDRCDVETDDTEEFSVTYEVETDATYTYLPQTYLDPAEHDLDPDETFEKLESVLNEAIKDVTFKIIVSDDFEVVEEYEPECFWDNEY